MRLRPHGQSENFYGDRNLFEVKYIYIYIQGEPELLLQKKNMVDIGC